MTKATGFTIGLVFPSMGAKASNTSVRLPFGLTGSYSYYPGASNTSVIGLVTVVVGSGWVASLIVGGLTWAEGLAGRPSVKGIVRNPSSPLKSSLFIDLIVFTLGLIGIERWWRWRV